MPLSRVQFETVSQMLTGALINIAKSRRVDEGTVFQAVIAREELDVPGRDFGREPLEVINPVAGASLIAFHLGQVNAYDDWFGAVDRVWRELEGVRVAYVFHRPEFDCEINKFDAGELDAMAAVFMHFGETISPSQLTTDSGDVYQRLVRNQGKERFPEIARCCMRLADQKRAKEVG